MKRAFSLVEVLVAMSVLAIILALMLQVVNGILASTRTQNQQMDSSSIARRALDIMLKDLQQAAIAENAALLFPADSSSTNIIAMLAKRRGPGDATTDHRFLAVRYSTNARHELFRSFGSVSLDEVDLLGSPVTNATNTPVNPILKGILGLQITAKTEGGENHSLKSSASTGWATNRWNQADVPAGWRALTSTSPSWSSTATNRTQSLEIRIAAINPEGYALLESTGGLPSIEAALQAPANEWREQIDRSDIPPETKSAIRIIARTISVP